MSQFDDASVAVSLGTIVVSGGVAWLTAILVGRAEVRRRERVGYLLSAYRRLHAASNRRAGETLEEPLGDIGLLGTPEQVELVNAFLETLAREKTADLTPLLASLRTSLRKELGLAKQVGPAKFLRVAVRGEEARRGRRG